MQHGVVTSFVGIRKNIGQHTRGDMLEAWRLGARAMGVAKRSTRVGRGR